MENETVYQSLENVGGPKEALECAERIKNYLHKLQDELFEKARCTIKDQTNLPNIGIKNAH